MNQSIEDASRNNWTTKQWAEHVGSWENEQGQVCFGSWQALAAMLSQFQQASRQSSQSEPVATADYVAYLYRDHNGTLKLAQEVPPPDNAFPVFTTNIRFLDVARLVLDDNVDLILEHGGVKLWEALVTKVNKDYAEKNHE
jgi:hypothetical protein